MLSISEKESLNVKGIVADMFSYEIDESVDIVLLDSVLHFYKRDKEKETVFLIRIMNELKVGGLICVFVWKSKKIEHELESIIKKDAANWVMLVDKYIDYPEKKMEMRMIAIQKKPRYFHSYIHSFI